MTFLKKKRLGPILAAALIVFVAVGYMGFRALRGGDVGAGALRTGMKVKILDATMQQKLAEKPEKNEPQTAAKKPD